MELWRPFAKTFDADNLTLFRTEHWSVLVRKGQVTLGTLVLAANRNFISASEFTQDELLELMEGMDLDATEEQKEEEGDETPVDHR